MQIEPVNIVQIAIASPAAIAAAGLAGRRRLRALAAFLIVFATHMTLNFVEETGASPQPVLVTPVLSLLYGPLIYLFVRGVIFKREPLIWRDLIHAAPAIIALFFTNWLLLIRFATILSLVGYVFVVIWVIWRYDRATKIYRSDAQALRLNWVIAVFAGFGILTALDVLRMLTRAFQTIEFQQAAYAGTLTAVASLLGTLVYFAVKRPRYFKGLTDEEFKSPEETTDTVVRPSAADSEAFAEIEAIILREKLFCQPHLTLFDLANHTRLAERDLSRLINQVSGRTFCDYINAFRIEETARLLTSSDLPEKTILEIAFDAGFTSKSTFNAVFKKDRGVTPSEFRRRGLISSE